ncbi:ACGX-repeat peptide [Clostridium akagii]|uniref:ACGX-repeat peptide n=1 Tax=Clostridium akagii TaxID=91623 RepID=UPI0005693693|nr:ACGX-repeat peptide [Clostridium akagii]
MIKLNMLDAWSGMSKFFGKRSAQSYLNSGNVTFAVSGGCGSACGAGDGDSKPKPKPEENPDPKPTACSSACGAGDK